MSPVAISNHQPLSCKASASTAARTIGIGHQVLELHEHVELREPVVGREPGLRRRLMLEAKRPPVRRAAARLPGWAHRPAGRAPARPSSRRIPNARRPRCWRPPGACTAYSMALASDRSPVDSPSAVAGGTRLPTLRMVKSSPGSVDTSRLGDDPAVGAGDEQRVGRLAAGELAEMLGILRQLVLAELDDAPRSASASALHCRDCRARTIRGSARRPVPAAPGVESGP